MCALPSISSTPYRTPLLPPSRSSYFSDINHLNNGNSVAPSPCNRRIHSMQRKPPLEAEINFPKQQAEIRLNISKVKLSLLILALMSIASILFAFTSLLSLFSIQWKATTIESSDFANDASIMIRTAMYEIASSLSLIAGTIFLSGGRILRCNMLQWMLVPGRIGTISRGVGAAFSIASTALCTAGLIHCVYVWCTNDDKKVQEDYINGNLSTLV
ncbi:hypothetical protein DINM_022411 [Dirofilaria immitis]|nr:hypothetical protein [Dirofilaria immitis]